MTQANPENSASNNRATADGLYQHMQKTRELIHSLRNEKVEAPAEKESFKEVRRSLKQYAALQKDVASRMMDADKRMKNGEVNANVAYGQKVTRFDMDKMTREMGNVYEAAEDYLSVCGKEPGMEASEMDKPAVQAGEKVAAFAKQGMTVSKEEASSIMENEKEAFALSGVKQEAPGLQNARSREAAPEASAQEEMPSGPVLGQ